MNDEQRKHTHAAVPDPSRRDFIALSVATGLAVAAGPALTAALPVVEDEVTVKTSDGTCDAAFIHPATGAYAGVLIWPDAFGLRPSMKGGATASADAMFDRLDVNHDGKLSTAEAAADPKVQSAWKKIDVNNKGAVSKAEFQAHASDIK